MADALSVEQLRAKLEAKRAWHLSALREIESGLAQFERLIELATGAADEPPRPRIGIPTAKAPAQEGSSGGAVDDKISEKVLELVRELPGPYDVKLTPEINSRYGLNLDEKQASNALRNLLKRGKIKLVRPGGPRKPALYANLDYDEADASQEMFLLSSDPG